MPSLPNFVLDVFSCCVCCLTETIPEVEEPEEETPPPKFPQKPVSVSSAKTTKSTKSRPVSDKSRPNSGAQSSLKSDVNDAELEDLVEPDEKDDDERTEVTSSGKR